jgi:hypothetical protein
MRIRSVILSALIVRALAPFVQGEEPMPARPQVEKKAAVPAVKAKPLPRVTIGKDTTFVLGPVRADGTVDFLAAINEHASQGVTPENNAAIPFWQIVGPAEIAQSMRDPYFKKLGIEALPEEGEYYLGFDAYLKLVEEGKAPGTELLTDDDAERAVEKRQLVEDQQFTAANRIWDAKEFPILADWLTRNDKQLDQMVLATRRSRFYSPYVPYNEGDKETHAIIAMLLPVAQAARDVARALVCRATLRLSSGKVAEAQADLLASHRLGRLIADGETLIESLVGIAIDGLANMGDQALAKSGKLSSKKLLDYATQLRALDRLPPMYEAIDFLERLMYIDCTWMVARRGTASLKHIVGDGGQGESAFQRMVDRVITGGVEWDTVLRFGNGWYDRLVAAGKEPDYAKQKAALAELDQELRALSQNAGDVKSFTLLILGKGLQAAATQRTGEVLVSLLLPATSAAFNAEHRSQIYNELTQFSLALAAYHADNGQYPAELAALKPKYLAAIPLDRYCGEAFRYRTSKDGYLLYSVGANDKDDEGRGPLDNIEDDQPGDDLAVKVGK